MKDIVVIEGADGSGKTTVVDQLASRFPDLRVMVRREPGSTAFGEHARALLIDPEIPMTRLATMLLFGACRAQLVAEILRSADQFDLLLLDRYWFSTVAYQAFGGGLSIDQVMAMNRLTDSVEVDGRSLQLNPRLCFYLDVDEQTAEQRKAHRQKDRFEAANQAFQRRVRTGYEYMVSQHQLQRVDATQPIQQVVDALHDQIRQNLSP